MHYRPLLGAPGVSVRVHGTTLYNSIYRADNELLVNTHLWGSNALTAPVWHLRRHEAGTLQQTYQQSFEHVWERATDVT